MTGRPPGPAYLDALARPTAVQLAAWVRCTPDDDMPAVVEYLEKLLDAAMVVDNIVAGLLVLTTREHLVRITQATPPREDTPT